MARPRIVLDENLVLNLAKIHCTNEEIAAVCNVSVDTIERRCAGIIKKGKEQGRSSLRRKQFEIALGGNVGMLIWLGKQHLGQRDKSELELQERPVDNAEVQELKKIVGL